MAFQNPIIGSNDELVRDKIRSENYVVGVSGWQIERAGDAEFNDVTVRGTVEVGTPPNPQVIIDSDVGVGSIRFPANSSKENDPPSIVGGSFRDGDPDESIFVILNSGTMDPPADQTSAQIVLESNYADGSQGARIILGAEGAAAIEIGGGEVFVTQAVTGSGLVLVESPWTTLTLAAGFTAGANVPAYQRRGQNTVRLRGQLNHAGAASGATILTLPVAIRPASLQRFSIAASTGVSGGTIRVDISTTGVMAVNWGGGGTTTFLHIDGIEYFLD